MKLHRRISHAVAVVLVTIAAAGCGHLPSQGWIPLIDGNAGQIELDDKRFCRLAGQCDAARIGKARCVRSDDHCSASTLRRSRP